MPTATPHQPSACKDAPKDRNHLSEIIPASVRGRLIRGFGATSLSPILSAATQLGTVPLFLHSWGAAKYGNWLILSAVPAYLSLSDLGFGSASGSDMTARVSAGDRKGAVCTFQSSWMVLNIVSLVIFVTVCLAALRLPIAGLFHLASLSNAEVATTICTLTAYVLVSQQVSVLESGYRCDGHFATGTFWLTMIRFVETFSACFVGIYSGNIALTAAAYLAIRVPGTIAYALLLRRISPWISIGVQHARLDRVKTLSRAALGFILLPAGTAFTLQGFTLVVGTLIGPIAVAVFSTMRTLSRMTLQVLSGVAHTIWPELSRAFGAGELVLARIVFRKAFQSALIGSALLSAFLWTAGPITYHFWVRHSLTFSTPSFRVLVLAAMANAIWYMSFAVPMANNTHYRLALVYAVAAAASLVCALPTTKILGLPGAASAVLLVDVCMVFFALREALAQLDDTWTAFLSSLMTFNLRPRDSTPVEPIY